MALYIMLAKYTDADLQHVKDTLNRVQAFENLAKKCGATVKEVYWAHGEYDSFALIKAPDELTIRAVALSVGDLGDVRARTLRAFTAAEMKTIVGKLV